ncbi:18010_t:CDS:1, partial [Cetraspora pellucida]
MNKHEYKNNKQDYDEIYFPLAEKAAEVRAQGNQVSSDERELTELITIVVSDYTDWKAQLTDLEDKLNKLKKYAQGGKKHNIVTNYSSTQQEALKKL